MPDLPDSRRPRTSTRSADAVLADLGRWLDSRLTGEATVRLRAIAGHGTAGFSSETLVFDAGTERLVLRLPPPADAFPLFPSYDLVRQATVMRLVRDRTAVPVPEIRWVETDPSVLGAPFFVMSHVDGEPVADLPPYVFEGWLLDADDERRAAVERSMVEVLAGVHGTPASPADVAFLELDAPGDTPLRRHLAHQRAYYEWGRDGRDFPVIDALFSRLEERWPCEGQPVVSWGDARPANVLFGRDHAVAVLDWESAAVGPRELDLGWAIYFHAYYQRTAARYGRPGLPSWFDPARVVAAYEQRSGHRVTHLDWYLDYAALRQALVSIRVMGRAVHFGERPEPADPQDLILDRAHLDEILRRP